MADANGSRHAVSMRGGNVGRGGLDITFASLHRLKGPKVDLNAVRPYSDSDDFLSDDHWSDKFMLDDIVMDGLMALLQVRTRMSAGQHGMRLGVQLGMQ